MVGSQWGRRTLTSSTTRPLPQGKLKGLGNLRVTIGSRLACAHALEDLHNLVFQGSAGVDVCA